MEIESNPVTAPVTAHGKFLSRANTKFFLKAIRLERQTTPLDLYKQVNLRDRLKKFHDSHTTSLIVAYDDAGTVLDVAAQAGLCTIVELSVAPDALLARKSLRAERERLAEQVRALSARPGLIGYLIECHLSQDFLRVHGFERVRRRLRALITTVRRSSLNLLVAIKHRPSTRAAALLEEDFVYSVVPPLSPVELKEYVTGLHNLAESRPVVIEFEQAMPDQDDLVASAFGLGAAGVVAPVARAIPRPDLMTLKMLTAAEVMPFLTLNGSCPPRHVATPMVSVVICAYNAERTMRPCLESLRKLDYPNYEVVIVDDGSRDRTAEISMDFPEFRLIRQPNKGLSVARNVGMQAARGELIAYTDSDCVVDPHWLTFMVRAMVESGFDGCGGPNYAPHEEGRVEGCVAASPGAPCHVLTGDDRAEHLAGCNMVFSKSALLAGRRLRSAIHRGRRRRRYLLADARVGFSAGLLPVRVRVAFSAQYGEGLLRPAARLRPGRSDALSRNIRSASTARARSNGGVRIPGMARTLPGGERQRVGWTAARIAPDRIRADAQPAQFPSADAGMEPPAASRSCWPR